MVIQPESLKKTLIISSGVLVGAAFVGVGLFIFQRQKLAPPEGKKIVFQPMKRESERERSGDLSHLSLERYIPGGAALVLSLENLPQEVKRFSESNLYQSGKAYFERLKAEGDLELEKGDPSGKGMASILVRLAPEGTPLSRGLQMAGGRARLVFYAPESQVIITTGTDAPRAQWLFMSELSTASLFFQSLQRLSARGLSIDEMGNAFIQMEGEEFFHALASNTWFAASNLTLLRDAIGLLQGATSRFSLVHDPDFSSVAAASAGKIPPFYIYIHHEKIFRMRTAFWILRYLPELPQYRTSWLGARWDGGLLVESATSLAPEKPGTNGILPPTILTLQERFPKGGLQYAWGALNPEGAFQQGWGMLKGPMMESFLHGPAESEAWLSQFEKRCLPLLSDEFGYAVMDRDANLMPADAIPESAAILFKSIQPKKLESAIARALKAMAKYSSLAADAAPTVRLKSRKYKKVKIKSLPLFAADAAPTQKEIAVARLEDAVGIFVGPPEKTVEPFVDVLKNEAPRLAEDLRFKEPSSHAFYMDRPRMLSLTLDNLSQTPLAPYLGNPGVSLLKDIFQSLLPYQGAVRFMSDGMMGEFHLGLKDLDRGQWDKIFVELDAQLAKPKRRWREQRAKKRLVELRQAVADYRGEKRQYPKNLKQLVPRYISEIPMEPLTRKAAVVGRPDGRGGWIYDKDHRVYPNIFGTDLTGIPYSQWGKMP